jgi:putative transcriptional regulator
MNTTEKFVKALEEAEARAHHKTTRGREFVTQTAVADADVRAIRKRLNLTQEEFAEHYGFSVDTIRNWEQGRRQPEGPARILLMLIDARPELVEEVLREQLTT